MTEELSGGDVFFFWRKNLLNRKLAEFLGRKWGIPETAGGTHAAGSLFCQRMAS